MVNYIKIYRKKLNLTQAVLAQAIGVARQTIAAWEKGDREPSLSQLSSISRFMNVPLTELINTEVTSSVQPKASQL